MSAELLSNRPDGHESTLVLTLSNPGKRNALDPDVYAAGIEAIDAAERDPSVRALVIAGGWFCPGSDPQRLLDERPGARDAHGEDIDRLGAWITALRQSRKPVVAAVEGEATDAGFALALAADLLVAADDATFSMTGALAGLTPAGGASWFVARALPRQLALGLLFGSVSASAVQLANLGVVNRLTKPGAALDGALALADRLAHASPNALARIKALVDQADGRSLTEHLVDERDQFVAALHHRDAREGLNALAERRMPSFK